MSVRHQPKVLTRLMEELEKMPGIGPKSAQRLAFHILRLPREEAGQLAEAIVGAREQITSCRACHHFTDSQPCAICEDLERDRSVILVVADPKDVMAVERAGEYRGLYHVLQGVLSPMDGVGPEQLTIRSLLARLEGGQVKEVILATDPTVEGDATALYLANLLKPLGLRVSRIAHGLPAGADLDYADEITIARAVEGRREM